MKKLFIAFLILTNALNAWAQNVQPIGTKDNTIKVLGNLQVVGWLAPGQYSDTPINVTGFPVGAIVIRHVDSTVWAYNGKIGSVNKWFRLGGPNSVTSVNGQTGAVTIVIPTDNAQLANGRNFITAAQAPVLSVNGNTGAVLIDGTETHIAAGANIQVLGLGTIASPYIIIGNLGGGGGRNADSIRGSPVDTTGKQVGYGITWNGTKWVTTPIGSSIASATDVQLTSLADGNLLKYNASLTKWVNFVAPWLTSISGTTVGGDLSGTLPNPTVSKFNGLAASYYLDYNNMLNKANLPITFNNRGDLGGNAAIGTTTINDTFLVTGLRGFTLPAPTTAGNLRWSGTAWQYDPAAYLTGITGSMITTALGGTPIIPSGTTLQYYRGNGTLSTTDTTMIPLFYSKVRSELSALAGGYLLFNATNGTLAADTSTGKLATQSMMNSLDSVGITHNGTWVIYSSLDGKTIIDKGFKNSITTKVITGTDSILQFIDDTNYVATQSDLTSLNATGLTSGVIAAARFGTANIPVTAINATGYVGAGTKSLMDDGTWKPSGAITNITTTPSPSNVLINSSNGSSGSLDTSNATNAGSQSPYSYKGTHNYTHFANAQVGGDTLAFGTTLGDSILLRDLLFYNMGGIFINNTTGNYRQLKIGLGFDTGYAAFQSYISSHLGIVKSVKTTTALYGVSTAGLPDSTNFFVTDSLQGGTWVWRSGSTKVDNFATVVQPAGVVGAGRFERIFPQGPWSIYWFGARGDGATDDAPAFNKAMAIAGINIYVPNPKVYYRTSSIIAFGASGVKLIGQDRHYTKIISDITVQHTIFRYRGISDIVIRNLNIFNQDTSSTKVGNCVAVSNDTAFSGPTPSNVDSNLVFDNLELSGPAGANGMFIVAHRSGYGAQLKYVTITNCYFHDLGSGAIGVLSESGSVYWNRDYLVRDNMVKRIGLRFPNSGLGISFAGRSLNITVDHNFVDSCTSVGLEMAYVWNSTLSNNVLKHMLSAAWSFNNIGDSTGYGNNCYNNKVMDTCNTNPYYINQNGLQAWGNTAVANTGLTYFDSLQDCKFTNDYYAMVAPVANATPTVWLRSSSNNTIFQSCTIKGVSTQTRLIFASQLSLGNTFRNCTFIGQASNATILTEDGSNPGSNSIYGGITASTSDFTQNANVIASGAAYIWVGANDSARHRMTIANVISTNSIGLTTSPLSQFASTTSSQLAGMISDETGIGAAVFAGSPVLTGTPTTPTAAPGTNTTQLANTAFVAAGLAGKQSSMSGTGYPKFPGTTTPSYLTPTQVLADINPMTTNGDMIAQIGGVATRLPAAAHAGQKIISLASGGIGWGDTTAIGGGGLAAIYVTGQLAIKGTDTIVKTDSIFYRGSAWGAGIAIPGNSLVNLAEASATYDTAQIITGLPSGTKVVRLWITDDTLGYPHVQNYESVTGAPGTWVGYSGDSVISGHYRGCIVKNGGYYYYYGVNRAETQLDVFVSPHGAPGSWTLSNSAVITSAGLGVTNIFNSWVYINGSNWYMMLDVGSGALGFSEYGFTSTDGVTWTAVTGNPIVPRGSGPWFTQSGGQWVYYGHSTMNSAILPSDIYTFTASAFAGPWKMIGNGSTIHRLTADEGVNTITGQIADPALVMLADSSTLLFTTCTNNGNSSGGAFIKVLRSPYTISQIIANYPYQNSPIDARLEALGNGDAVFNTGHIGLGTEAPTAMLDVQPYAGIDSGYADIRTVNVGNTLGSSIFNVGFNARYGTFAGWGNLDHTKVGYITSYATTGATTVYTPIGYHPTPLTLGGWLYNGTNGIFSVGGFGTIGKMFFNSTTDDGSGNALQMNGYGATMGNITGGNLFNSNFIGPGNVASTTNLGIGTTKAFASGTGTNNLAIQSFMNSLTGSSNVGLASGAGSAITSGSFNTFAGTLAGNSTTSSSNNTAFGRAALFANTTGAEASILGANAGRAITTHNLNSALGGESFYTDATLASSASIDTSTAIGALAQVTQSSSIVLGGSGKYKDRVSIGNPAPQAWLHVPAGLGITNYSSLKFDMPTITTTALAGNGSQMTITFAAQTYIPFMVGQVITITGATPSGYNGDWTVIAATTTTITISGAITGSQSVAGTITAMAKPTATDYGAFGFRRDSLFVVGPSGAIYNLTFPAAGATNPFSDAAALVKNSSDATKLAIFSAVNISTATTRTYTLPDVSGTLPTINNANTWTGAQSFTGATVTVTTQSPGDNSTKVGSTAYTDAAILVAKTKKFAMTADASVNNTTTPTSLIGTGVGSMTVATNTLIVGSVINFKGSGNIQTAISAPTMQFSFSVGSSSATVTPTIGVSLNGQYEFEFQGIVRTSGASGTIELTGWVSITGTKTYIAAGAFALDTTTGNLVDLVLTMGGTVGSGDIVTTKTSTLNIQ